MLWTFEKTSSLVNKSNSIGVKSIVIPFTCDVALLGLNNHSGIILMTQSVTDYALRYKICWLMTVLVNNFLGVDFLGFFIVFSDINVRHIDNILTLVEDKDVGVDVFDTVIMDFNIDSEERTQKGQQLISGDEVI